MAYLCFIILPDACFSYDTPCNLAFFPPSRAAVELENVALRHQNGVPQRPAAKRLKLTVDLSRPSLARLALGVGHRQTRNGPGLASGRLSTALDLEGAARPTWSFRARSEISSGKEASFKASNKGWVVCDHPGEVRPRIPVGENRVKLLFNRRCSFHRNLPFLLGKGILSDRFPEACSREQLRDSIVVAATLQAADEVGCCPRLEAVEPLPRPRHIKRVRNEVLAAAGRP